MQHASTARRIELKQHVGEQAKTEQKRHPLLHPNLNVRECPWDTFVGQSKASCGPAFRQQTLSFDTARPETDVEESTPT